MVKPDIVAPDGVDTVSYGAQPFYGTSAAAPCAAGAAALVKDAYPSYSRTQIKSYLENPAVGLGAAGKDNIYGSGRLLLGNPQKLIYNEAQSSTAAGFGPIAVNSGWRKIVIADGY